MPGMVLLHVARRLAGAAISNATPIVLPRTSDPADDDDGSLSSLLAQKTLPDNIGWWIVLLILNLLYIVPVCIFVSLPSAPAPHPLRSGQWDALLTATFAHRHQSYHTLLTAAPWSRLSALLRCQQSLAAAVHRRV